MLRVRVVLEQRTNYSPSGDLASGLDADGGVLRRRQWLLDCEPLPQATRSEYGRRTTRTGSVFAAAHTALGAYMSMGPEQNHQVLHAAEEVLG